MKRTKDTIGRNTLEKTKLWRYISNDIHGKINKRCWYGVENRFKLVNENN